jgi:hypothetical protein
MPAKNYLNVIKTSKIELIFKEFLLRKEISQRGLEKVTSKKVKW